jgi:hypothetical protein
MGLSQRPIGFRGKDKRIDRSIRQGSIASKCHGPTDYGFRSRLVEVGNSAAHNIAVFAFSKILECHSKDRPEPEGNPDNEGMNQAGWPIIPVILRASAT